MGYVGCHARRYKMTLRACDKFINGIIRYPSSIANRVRSMRFRMLGVVIGKKCWIRRVSIPRNPWDILIEDMVALDDEVVLLITGRRRDEPRLIIGSGTYVNRFTMFDASERIEVGENCLIGPYCYITDHDHGIEPGTPIAAQCLIGQPVRIGSNVWIGAGVTILKGVSIGNGAVVGAGAVVTRNIQAGQKVAGVPARVIGSRYT
jgi:maltose O-acetyltransferase